MSRPHLRHGQPAAGADCLDHGVGYAQVGRFELYAVVVCYLDNVDP